MRFLTILALVSATAAIVIPRGNDVLLKGALCRPCVDLLTNSENKLETEFNTWFTAETERVCSDLGFLKDQCIDYFRQYENDFDHFVQTKAEPNASCKKIEFC